MVPLDIECRLKAAVSAFFILFIIIIVSVSNENRIQSREWDLRYPFFYSKTEEPFPQNSKQKSAFKIQGEFLWFG